MLTGEEAEPARPDPCPVLTGPDKVAPAKLGQHRRVGLRRAKKGKNEVGSGRGKAGEVDPWEAAT